MRKLIIVAAAIVIVIAITLVAVQGDPKTMTDAEIIEMKQSIALDTDAIADATQRMEF